VHGRVCDLTSRSLKYGHRRKHNILIKVNISYYTALYSLSVLHYQYSSKLNVTLLILNPEAIPWTFHPTHAHASETLPVPIRTIVNHNTSTISKPQIFPSRNLGCRYQETSQYFRMFRRGFGKPCQSLTILGNDQDMGRCGWMDTVSVKASTVLSSHTTWEATVPRYRQQSNQKSWEDQYRAIPHPIGDPIAFDLPNPANHPVFR
jgi:hypothetical protein